MGLRIGWKGIKLSNPQPWGKRYYTLIYLNLGAVRCGFLGESLLVALTVMIREILTEEGFPWKVYTPQPK